MGENLAAEELGDALLPLSLRTALTQAPLNATLRRAVDVQWRGQPACTLTTQWLSVVKFKPSIKSIGAGRRNAPIAQAFHQ